MLASHRGAAGSPGAARVQPSTRRRTAASLRSLAFLSTLLILLASAVTCVLAGNPSVKVTRFESLPSRLSYFDDSTVVLYHDGLRRIVYRSEDEGKTWKPVAGVKAGDANMLVEHPRDTRMAFILTEGTTHYRSTDRGATWQTFKTPNPPATRAGPPLEFHADEKHYETIIFTGKKCKPWTPWGSAICHDEAYYTTDAFATPVKGLMEFLMHCTWAKSSKQIAIPQQHINRILCIAWEDSPVGSDLEKRSTSAAEPDLHGLAAARRAVSRAMGGSAGKPSAMANAPGGPTRLFYTDDFFAGGKKNLVQFNDLGRDARHFVGVGASNQYLVTALRDVQGGGNGGNGAVEMAMFVSRDGDRWDKAKFPHGTDLKEGAYTVVEGTTHSLVVDVLDAAGAGTGTLYTSDSEGIHFVQSLDGTHRNARGIVDYEHLQNVEGIGLANVRDLNGGAGENSKIKTMITYDDGSRWELLKPPSDVKCPDGSRGGDLTKCSLHLWSVTKLHNTGRVFSSTAPGFVMGVGTVGDRLLPYEDCDTFLSTDAGKSWRKVSDDAHKYEFGDQGSLLVIVDDEDSTNHVSYSWNQGKSWSKLNLGLDMRAKILTTIPDSTSLKFLLIGTQSRKQAGGNKARHVAVFLDFATVGKRKCGSGDMEKWYAEGTEGKCIMGHRQWYMRRKPEADCIVGDKFKDPVGHEDPCPCSDADYECDFNFVRDANGQCVASGPEQIPAGACQGGSKSTFEGSSGYRKIPGNSCDDRKGIKKDAKVSKPCKEANVPAGEVSHQVFELPGVVVDHVWFPDSPNLLVQVSDGSIWRSLNDGFSWSQLHPPGDDGEGQYLTMALHAYDRSRAYLIGRGLRVQYTYNSGKDWNWFTAPLEANGLGIPILDFHPDKSDWLIWTGSRDCASTATESCRAEAWYTTDQGSKWHKIDDYIRTCSWMADSRFKVGRDAIVCESWKDKKGSQRSFDTGNNKLQLVTGWSFYTRKDVAFESVVGFDTQAEYMVVAELAGPDVIRFKVSLDARHFADAVFPPNTKINPSALTVLDSVTDAIFLHVTTHSKQGEEWGTLFKSNWNGTYFGLSLEHVNRNSKGFVDFEKMLGLDGIAVLNVVGNADDASVSGRKELQTRITHNDGGRWKTLTPPRTDAMGQPYKCPDVGCALHLHGYTERTDPRATYSSPTAVGLMVAVGNVGRSLAAYEDGDTFLTRDGGFTWTEVRKDAHRWEFGDQGTIIVLVDDERPTDIVVYSTDEGRTWSTYNFGRKLRVTNLITVPEDTHRKFVLFGTGQSQSDKRTTAVHLDFSRLQNRKCKLNPSKPEADDFTLWSPSEERSEACLFGRQTYYYRRKRDADCYIGERIVQPHEVSRNCSCTLADFECEFNFYPDPANPFVCIPYPGAKPLVANIEEQCSRGEDYWYDRTSVRRIPHSSCEGGTRPDRGARHSCPAAYGRRRGFWFWIKVILAPFVLAGVVGWWWSHRAGVARGGRGSIRLPGTSNGFDTNAFTSSLASNERLGPALDTLASVPYFVAGVAGTVWAKAQDLAERVPWYRRRVAARRGAYGGYRSLRTDEDAEILRADFADEEEEE